MSADLPVPIRPASLLDAGDEVGVKVVDHCQLVEVVPLADGAHLRHEGVERAPHVVWMCCCELARSASFETLA